MTTALTTRQDVIASQQADTDEQLIDLFLRRKRSHHTRRTYRLAIEQFRRFVAYKPLANVTLGDLLDYQDHLAGQYSTASQQLKLNAVRSLFTFAQKVGYLHFNVGAAVELPQAEKRLAERILSEEQVLRVLDSPKRHRDRVLLRLLYSSGIRVSELCNLQWRHVQPNGDTGQLTIFGKGEKTRAVPISKATYRLLLSLAPDDAGPEDYVFQSQKGGKLDPSTVFRIVRKAGRAVGIPDLSPHWLRHSHASHALARGASLAVVKETLGHSNIAVTDSYLHAKPNDSSAFYLAV